MIELNSPVWLTLDSASGGVGNLLDKLLRKEGDFRENMEALAEELGHQLSYYSATSYALPHLAALCAGLPPRQTSRWSRLQRLFKNFSKGWRGWLL